MAHGRIVTGFSLPKVAKYDATSGTPKYTGVTPLARGVSVSLEVNTSDSQNFYADNVLAESAGGRFTDGTATLSVDGLKDEARKLIMGLPEPTTVTVDSATVKKYVYDDKQVIPYVGIGFVVRYMENGVESFVPYILTKAIFDVDGLDAETQGETIDFQAQELTASIMRDDSDDHAWRWFYEAQKTEAEAEKILLQELGGK